MRRLTIPLAATAALLLALAGCAAEASTAQGEWGSTAQGKPNLQLLEDGSLSGSDGCNRLVGQWSEADGTVEFTNVASTMMACENVDTWLSALATGEVDGGKLVVFNEDGDQIGELKEAS